MTYSEDAEFRARFLDLANKVAERGLIARHYLYLGQRQRSELYADDRTIRLKKLFYSLRPAVALRWLRLHPDVAVAPMHFLQLMEESDIPADVVAIVSDLIRKKKPSRASSVRVCCPKPLRSSSMPNSMAPLRLSRKRSGTMSPRRAPRRKISSSGRWRDWPRSSKWST